MCCLIKPERDNYQIGFSVPSGVYDEDFELEITDIPEEKGIEVHYSLNGNTPSAEDPVYQGPISIKDATSNPNYYSNITDVSLALNPERLYGYEGIYVFPQYTVPDYDIDKCTVVKAACFNKGEIVGKVITGSYFVNYTSKRGYENISIMSLTVDYDDFFGYENGIYVTGKSFDNYLNYEYPNGNTDWRFRPANYNMSGKKHEVTVNIDYFDENHCFRWSRNAGVKVNGNASRSFNPKSLALCLKNEYDSVDSGFDFWETGYNANEIILFSGSNDYNTRLNDPAAAEIAYGLDVAAVHFTPCQLFINGEYWGLYFITEKYNQDFFNYYYNLNNKITVIKDNSVVDGDDIEINSLNYMINFISDNDMSEDEFYEKASELLDIEQFASYMAVETYIARCGDWPWSNFGWWKVSKSDGSDDADTRWKCFLFDVNWLSMDEELSDFNSFDVLNKSPVFKNLWKNDEFKDLFNSKIVLLCRQYSPEKMKIILDGYNSMLDDAIAVHNLRFYGNEDYGDSVYSMSGITSHSQAVERVYGFFDKRGEYLLSVLCSQ